MLINGYEKKDNLLKSKICVIGSGIGGGTISLLLEKSSLDFIIIEAGEFSGNSTNVIYENIGREFGIRTTTTIQIGGTSNLWHGVLSPLDRIDFIKRDWIPNSGWPITLDDLNPFYKQASYILGLDSYDYFSIENLPNYLLKQVNYLEINRELLVNKIFQQVIPAYNFKSIIKKICDKSIRYHCLYNTTALELIYKNNGIKKLKVGYPDGGIAFVEADYYILAAGALQTPRILLNSHMCNINIGKYLMDHPMGNLCQIELKYPNYYPIYTDTRYKKNIKIKSGLELTRKVQEKLKLPNNNFYLRPSFVRGIDDLSEKIKLSLLAFKDKKITSKDIFNVLSHPNVIRQILQYKLSYNVKLKYADLFFITEQIPNPNSTITLSSKCDRWGYPISRINWQVTDQDILSMKKYMNLVLNEFFSHDNYRFTHTLDDFNWEETFTSAVHHVGTARMGGSDQDGVVDKNLKVFNVDNLYICDGSIFPTAGNVNNGLSISAFACRLANYLIEKLK